MRIWILAENWPPRIGGIENYLSGIAEHLGGHDVTVIAPKIYQGESTTNLIRKRFFWPMWPKWLPLYVSLKKIARANRPDIILCGKALVEGRIAKLLKRSLGIPFIVCTYGMEIATWSQNPRTRIQLEKVLQSANAVLYINKQTKQELLALGVPKNNLHSLYPGIDQKKLLHINNPDEVLGKYAITAPYIITVCRLVKRKGVDDLISAFATLTTTYLTPTSPSKGEETNAGHPSPYEGEGIGDEVSRGVSLVIVGDGPERATLEKRAQELHANVVFLGHIPDEDLHALYTKAKLFALTPKQLPNDYEGFGIVYLEAAFFGLPAVGTNTGGVAEAVQDGVTGVLAEPGNIASIQNALQKIVSHPTLFTQYGQNGKERVMNDFLWENCITKLESIMRNII